jgi:hypothetical protein
MLKPELLYCNMSQAQIYFVYNPDNHCDFNEELKALFEYILEKFEHGKDKKKLIPVYDLYQKIADGECDFLHMTQQLESVSQENEKEAESKEAVIEEVIPEEIESEVEVTDVKKALVYKAACAFTALLCAFFAISFCFPGRFFVKLPSMVSLVGAVICAYALVKLIMCLKKTEKLGKIVEVKQKEKYSFSQEDDFAKDLVQKNTHEEAAEPVQKNTVLLSDYVRLNNNKELQLIPVTRAGTHDFEREVITIREFPWVIGSMENYCNTVLDDGLVSRIHLSVYREDEEYYIEDMNSTNGTFLNDERLSPQSRCKLNVQDCITIADKRYRVEKA